MVMNSITIFVISLFLFLTGCGSGTVEINSLPQDAHVSIVNSDGSFKDLGKVGNFSENQIFATGDTVQLYISRNNYVPQSVVLTKGVFPKRYNISVNLKRDGSDQTNVAESIEEVAKAIAASYNLLKEKDYDGVIRLLTPIANKYSGVSVTNDFLGNAYYLKGNYRKAYKYYSLALQTNPNNFDRREIVRKIKAMMTQ
jgi:tetratricopeptide (TPR) repeat protein